MTLNQTARAELTRRYAAVDRANLALADYLLGVLHTIGIEPEAYAGFDDVSGEILVKAEVSETPPTAE